ncbi:hypothetical protein EOL70_03220 [Leucothrix sargassi]|nr:hypothetical protein EOL70_03220 [Leucothrix sargassi]
MFEYQVVSEMRSLLKSGFYSKEKLIEIYSDEICESCDLSPEAVVEIIDADFQQLDEQKHTWPAVTDVDRLEAAFEALSQQGFICLHNAGGTQSEANKAVQDKVERHTGKESVVAYCFYHTPDLERAVRGMGLYLAFGPIDTSLEDSEGPKIGERVREALEQQGLEVEWDGTFNTRMLLPTISWQKR